MTSILAKEGLDIDVLIIGAGPTGLAAAANLAKNGVRVRIIDKNKERSDKSRALGVQSGTLESLDYFLSPTISQNLISSGFPARAASIHINSHEPIEVNLSAILPPYDFILVIEQSKTERILEEYLNSFGVKVESSTECDSNVEENGIVRSTIKNHDGKTEVVASRFAIGCDGAHSTVRRQLDIPFEGGQYSGDFILGDVKIKWPWSYQSIRVFVTEKGVIASFPMTDGWYRLILVPKGTAPVESSDIGMHEFISVIQTLSRNRIEVIDSKWLTRFRVHHRIVKSFRKGNIFLAGDAAHIHSPAGGQGMNVGIQEAFNLTSKIADVIVRNKNSNILDSYEKERLPIARMVLRSTDFAYRMALLRENFLTGWTRNSLLPKVVKLNFLQQFVVRGISEIKVARKEIEQRKLDK